MRQCTGTETPTLKFLPRIVISCNPCFHWINLFQENTLAKGIWTNHGFLFGTFNLILWFQGSTPPNFSKKGQILIILQLSPSSYHWSGDVCDHLFVKHKKGRGAPCAIHDPLPPIPEIIRMKSVTNISTVHSGSLLHKSRTLTLIIEQQAAFDARQIGWRKKRWWAHQLIPTFH